MLQQGLRCFEISRLLLSDIDMGHQTMRTTGKGGHERVLPLMDETLACLISYLGKRPATASRGALKPRLAGRNLPLRGAPKLHP
jgi:site-specific recombinase XerD